MEHWKTIPGYDRYQVSDLGNIKSLVRGERLLKPKPTRNGYRMVYLTGGDGVPRYKAVHRLVAVSFIPNPENKSQVNHKDGDKSNNCMQNLEWVTPSENALHSFRILHHKKSALGKTGALNKNSKPICQYDLCGNFVREWPGVSEAARGIGCSSSQILNVVANRIVTCHGFLWSYEKSDTIDASRVRNKKTHKTP